MNWSTLAPTLLGGLLALGGSMLGQWWNERRAIQREERNRSHNHEVWARQLRYETHVAFLKILDRVPQRPRGIRRTRDPHCRRRRRACSVRPDGL